MFSLGSFTVYALYTVSCMVVGILFARDIQFGEPSDGNDLPGKYKVTLGIAFLCSAILGAYSSLSIALRLAYIFMSLLLGLFAFALALKFFRRASA